MSANLPTSAGNHHRKAGFTLAELAIVLAVLSIVASTLMLEMVSGSAVGAQEKTFARMQAIEQSLTAYWVANGRLPCPAYGDAKLDEEDYGVAAGEAGDCTADGGALLGPISPTCNNWNSACPATCTSDCGAVLGVVPVRTLNLPDEFGLDGWNRRITYVVDERFTKQQDTTIYSPALVLSENHASPATARLIGRYPLLLISHGRAGDRAFPANGSTVAGRPATVSPNNTELHNITHTAFNNRFVSQPFRPDLPKDDGRFDQILRALSFK